MRATLCCSERASHCGGFSCCGARALGHTGFSSCEGLVALQHVESSSTRGWTHVPCIGRQILIHCMTREILRWLFVLSELWLLSYSFFFSLHYLYMDAGETFPMICVWMSAVVWTSFWQKYSERRDVLRKSEPPWPESLLSPRATVVIFLPFFPSLFFFFFWPHHTACGILFPKQGSNTGPMHWKYGVLTTGPPRKPSVSLIPYSISPVLHVSYFWSWDSSLAISVKDSILWTSRVFVHILTSLKLG